MVNPHVCWLFQSHLHSFALRSHLHSDLGAILLHPTVDCTKATFAHPFGPPAVWVGTKTRMMGMMVI